MTNISLSDGEWKLMNKVWELAPCSLTTLVAALYDETQWSKSTIFVMLRRLIAKGAVELDKSEKIQVYVPLVTREECAEYETKSFLSMVYDGSIGLMFSALTEKKSLSGDEIAELKKILDDAEKELSSDEGK